MELIYVVRSHLTCQALITEPSLDEPNPQARLTKPRVMGIRVTVDKSGLIGQITTQPRAFDHNKLFLPT